MRKRKNLNGIPHNITKSFFGTERYWSCGYMGDWLLKAARRLNLKEASLNVLDATFYPKELNLHPLTINAKTLKAIIDKELLANGFDKDFFIEVKINFQFPDPQIYKTTIYCFPYLVDKEGKIYKTDRIIEEGLEDDFNPFDELNVFPKSKSTFIDKFKNLFG